MSQKSLPRNSDVPDFVEQVCRHPKGFTVWKVRDLRNLFEGKALNMGCRLCVDADEGDTAIRMCDGSKCSQSIYIRPENAGEYIAEIVAKKLDTS